MHRIDRETSGVLLLAKTDKGYAHLKEQFQTRTIDKVYHLFVYGVMKQDEGIIDLPMGRNMNDFRKKATGKAAKGEMREASTNFRVLERLEGSEATFVEARPKTGRTHQIRVHFKDIHHPVVCDKLYAPKKDPILGFERLALHARSIQFDKLEGEKMVVESPYPEDFQQAIDNIG